MPSERRTVEVAQEDFHADPHHYMKMVKDDGVGLRITCPGGGYGYLCMPTSWDLTGLFGEDVLLDDEYPDDGRTPKQIISDWLS